MGSSVLMDCGCNVVRRLSQLMGQERSDRVEMVRTLNSDFASIDACRHFARAFRSFCIPDEPPFVFLGFIQSLSLCAEACSLVCASHSAPISSCSVLFVSLWRGVRAKSDSTDSNRIGFYK